MSTDPNPSRERLDRSRVGILYVVAGVALFSVQDVIIKGISGSYPVHQIVFVRSLLAAVVIVLIARLEGPWSRLRTQRPGLHLLRAVIAFLTYILYYLSLATLPLADAVTLHYSAPLFVTALSLPLLGERVGPSEWLAVCIGFAGVVVAMRPGATAIDPAAILPVLAALTYAIGSIITRSLGSTDSGSSMALYSTIFMAAAGGAMGAVLGQGRLAGGEHASLQFLLRPWTVPSWPDLGLMGLCGLVSAVGYMCLAQAYRVAPVRVVAPFEYAAVPLAAIWGFLLWGDVPRTHVVLGMLIILGSSIYVLRRQGGEG
jgi:S-adenosylmethionine uptake transporter